MRKLKIILPSVALLVVLAFSITIGVYAATNASFSVSSTVIYIAPDLDVSINAYIGEVSGTPDYSYPTSTEPWAIEEGMLKFARKDNQYQPIIITFVVYNSTNLPAHCYFTKKDAQNNSVVMTSDVLNGVTQTEKSLVNVEVSVDSEVQENGIPAYLGSGEVPSAEFKLTFTLIEGATMVEDKVEFKDYTFKVSKSKPTV